ncbi:MAG: exopolysaccharide biosynthesis protein [Verrucomicrobia bacterium]|nr:exopolysaccharide biosynthesis protein [Verrucomicrobiota bacterium]
MSSEHEPLSEKLQRILVNDGTAGLTLNELIRRTEGRGVFLIIILFSLPFVTPIALAGLSNILGWIIMLMSIRLARSLPPRLPGVIGERLLPAAHLGKLARGSVKVLRLIEKLVKPRRTNWMTWRSVRCGNALLLAFMAFLLALPIPPIVPFSNTLPCYAIILIAASMMEEDGFLIWLGYTVSLGTAVYFFLVGEVIFNFFARYYDRILHWFQSWL